HSYPSDMIPISFPYRDMGKIRDLIDLYSVKEKEKRAEKSRKLYLMPSRLPEKEKTNRMKCSLLLVITYYK
nr:hypothetical protein [Candidatus Cloacimonas acidaminovorans]